MTPEERCAIVGMQAQDCGQDVSQAYRMTGNAIPVALHAALIRAFLEPHKICAAELGGESPSRPNDEVDDTLAHHGIHAVTVGGHGLQQVVRQRHVR